MILVDWRSKKIVVSHHRQQEGKEKQETVIDMTTGTSYCLCMVVPHFSKSISQTMTFWELGLGLSCIRVILRGKLGFYGRSKVLEKWSLRREVGYNLIVLLQQIKKSFQCFTIYLSDIMNVIVSLSYSLIWSGHFILCRDILFLPFFFNISNSYFSFLSFSILTPRFSLLLLYLAL